MKVLIPGCIFSFILMFGPIVFAQTPPDLTTLTNYPNPTAGNSCSTIGNPNSNAAKKASNRLKNRFTLPGVLEPLTLEQIKTLPFQSGGALPSIDFQSSMRPVTVIGYAQESRGGGRFATGTGEAGVPEISRVDLDDLEDHWATDLQPLWLQLAEQQPEIAGDALTPVPLPPLDEGPHLVTAAPTLGVVFGAVLGEQAHPPGVDRRHARHDDGLDQAVQRPEVVLRRRLVPLAGGGLHLAQRDVAQPALGHQPLGGVDHRFTGGRARHGRHFKAYALHVQRCVP